MFIKVGKECVFYSPHWERTAIAFLAFSATLEGLAIGSEGGRTIFRMQVECVIVEQLNTYLLHLL